MTPMFSALFNRKSTTTPAPPTNSTKLHQQPAQTPPNSTEPHQIPPNSAPILFPPHAWLLPFQRAWIDDNATLRIWEKSRQIGATKTDALDSVLKASPSEARLDVWVTSRDEAQALLYLEDCRDWAAILQLVAKYEGAVFLDQKNNTPAHVLQFANGRKIYCLSSNPNALAGKRGHVKMDEFALHSDQRTLFKIAFPVTTWGGSLSVMSTHRGPNSYFNQIIRDILHNGNPMGWSHHKTTIHQAIANGIVERINEKNGRNESRHEWENRIHRQCGTEEAWNEEYCCIPSDESAAFLTHDMISACEDHSLKLLTTDQLIAWLQTPEGENTELYLGMDVGRTRDLSVIDVGAKIGDIIYDKLRLELAAAPFPVQERELYRLLELRQLRRACIDHNGPGIQLSEDARDRFGCKVEPVHITAPVKEQLAFNLRNGFESLALKIVADQKLHADLHAIRKLLTSSGNIRLDGSTDDSHCDRFIAKALRHEAARTRAEEPWIYPPAP